MHITVNLEAVLDDRNVTLYELCKVAEISYQQGSEILKQRTKGISFEVLEKLCLILNCQISELLTIKSDTEGYLSYLLSHFEETDNVKRLPQTKSSDSPKPFLQWVGGKREMLKQYEKFYPKKFNTFWEPFVGGGAMYFALNAKSSVINDNNPELIRTYEAVRDNPEAVIDILAHLRRKHSKELYMAMRSIDRKLDIYKDLKSYEIAARMIYLNQTCFNGVYRVNKTGQFNVPIGSSLNRVICDPIAIRNASRLLQSTKIECQDFETLLNNAKKGDFIYLDPPYHPISEYSDFTRYTKEKFYKHDQERLRDTFKLLSERGCFVMLSNSNAPLIRDLYSDFHINDVYSGRTLNSRKERRGKITELLITNY